MMEKLQQPDGEKNELRQIKIEAVKDGWKNRRAIAWISFLFSILYTFVVIGAWITDPDLARLLVDLSPAVYTLAGANLTWYFTMATWEDIQKK